VRLIRTHTEDGGTTVWAILGVVALLVLTAVLAALSERERRRLKISRFVARELVPVDRLIESLPGRTAFTGSSLVQCWKTAASVLKIDPRLLRPSDRFDHELAPVKGFPVEDELVELGELLQEVIDESGMTEDYANCDLKLETFGEYVRFLARLRDKRH
jgi:hypothetical protein